METYNEAKRFCELLNDLNQKKLLAQGIVDKLKDGYDFDDLIDTYSEGTVEGSKSEYYLKSELIEELKIKKLKSGILKV